MMSRPSLTNSELRSAAIAVSQTDGSNITIGSQADSAASTDTGTFSLLALIKRGLQNWTTLLARTPTLISGRIPVDSSGVIQPIGGIFNTTSPTLTNGQQGEVQMDSAGRVMVNTSGTPLGLGYALAAGANRLSGQSSVTAFGYSPNTGSGVNNVNVWEPQVAWSLATTAVGIEFKSSSASDGVGGTGARKIMVIGVGPAFALQVETVTMNGTTVVASAYTWMAINTMVVFDDPVTGFGSNKTNVGDISAKVTGAGATHGWIAAGKGVSHHGRYTVPAGYTWVINNFFALGNKAGSASASYSTNSIFVSPNGLLIYGLPLTMQNGVPLQVTLPQAPVTVMEKNTLMFTIESVSVGGLDISFGCTGLQTAN